MINAVWVEVEGKKGLYRRREELEVPKTSIESAGKDLTRSSWFREACWRPAKEGRFVMGRPRSAKT
jgi:hypothetical protein